YHRLQKWTGRFYQDAGLWEVGVRLSVGHMGGNCPAQKTCMRHAQHSAGPADSNSVNVDDDPEDPEWQDVAILETDPVPLRTPTPTKDDLEIQHILIVDASGLISLPVIWCRCQKQAEEAGKPDEAERVGKPDEQLLDLQMLAASYDKIKTVFSFHCLDNYRLSNLECKTSAYQYYQKLRRLTNLAFPQSVPNRYNEFCWATRQWRNLKLRKWFGLSHRLGSPTKGSMALFCAACPQPGVNLLADHMSRYSADETMRSFVVDGNFTADHIKQTRPDDDVWLTDGEGFMTATGPYAVHIKKAVDPKQTDTSESLDSGFRAILDANMGSGVKDVTGIAVRACARHGCYCPSSCVNFFKGEQQKCIDYSVSEAFQTTNCVGVRKVLEIYDIMCQYYKKMDEHFIAGKGYISHPPVIDFEKAIGMFHVHGHQDDCLFRFATNFMKGAGMVDGEILETLWSTLNGISPSMRTATLAHRSEVLDDHMNDSNWKKIVSISESASCIGFRFSHNEYFKDLTKVPSVEQLNSWESEISKAEEQRSKDPKAMDVMKTRILKAKTLAEMRLELLNCQERGVAGETAWLLAGLKLEEQQLEIDQIVSRMGKRPTAEKISTLLKRRDNLVKSMAKFNTDSQKYLGVEAFMECIRQIELIPGDFEDDWDPIDPPTITPDRAQPEASSIALPSVLPDNSIHRPSLARIMGKELELRKGHANDCLAAIRIIIGQEAFKYKKELRPATDKVHQTQAQSSIQTVHRSLVLQSRVYKRTREAMMSLNLDSAILDSVYKELHIRALQCVVRYDSWNGHSVPYGTHSRNTSNPGISPTIYRNTVCRAPRTQGMPSNADCVCRCRLRSHP
ncbi:hypothetical protein BYT27DRAFT_7280526, partial [Phlegmacium glaucopus]